MQELIEWIVSAGILFLMAIILFFYGIHARSRNFFYSSFLFLFLALCVGAWTGWLFVKKSYNKLESLELPTLMEERGGPAIYEAMFGRDSSGCVEIHNRKDQVMPRLDCWILLEFSACPAELRRIIHHAGMEQASVQFKRSDLSCAEPPKWFEPEYLGPDRKTFISGDASSRLRVLIISPDSSRAFYCDIAD